LSSRDTAQSAQSAQSAQRSGAGSRALSEFTVELDVYSGPYEWLLALILREELEIFEIPLRDLVGLYRTAHPTPDPPRPDYPGSPDEALERALERDTDFVDSATSLVLLKSRTLAPAAEPDPEEDEGEVSPEELAERLSRYLKIKRAAESLSGRLSENAGHYPSAHEAPPRAGQLKIDPARLAQALSRASARLKEPPTRHMGPITVTLQELASLIISSLNRSPGAVSFEELTREMDRLRAAVTFAAALSMASEGRLRLSQTEPMGPLTLEAPA
jgi:segregation and condensation protein A